MRPAGKSNKAGWESDTDIDEDGDDMESEDEEDARKWMEELRKKQGGPREQDKAVTAPTGSSAMDTVRCRPLMSSLS